MIIASRGNLMSIFNFPIKPSPPFNVRGPMSRWILLLLLLFTGQAQKKKIKIIE